LKEQPWIDPGFFLVGNRKRRDGVWKAGGCLFGEVMGGQGFCVLSEGREST